MTKLPVFIMTLTAGLCVIIGYALSDVWHDCPEPVTVVDTVRVIDYVNVPTEMVSKQDTVILYTIGDSYAAEITTLYPKFGYVHWGFDYSPFTRERYPWEVHGAYCIDTSKTTVDTICFERSSCE